MNNSTSNKNLELVSLDWNAIQIQMKEKYATQLAAATTSDAIMCINIAYSCPDEKAEEVKAVFKEHAAWMEEFYKVLSCQSRVVLQ